VQTVKNQPIKWHGGKSYLAAWIHSLAPPSVIDDPVNGYTHRNIAFAGGLGEFWNWQPVEGIAETVNDANSHLSAFWKILASEPHFKDFKRCVEGLPLCQEFWQDCVRELEDLRGDDDMLVRAVAFFVKYRMSRQGLGKDYCTPTRRTRRGMNEQVSAWLTAVDGLPEAHARLRRVEILNIDALKFIDKLDHERALFYLDPPYLHETRSSTGEYGKHEMTPAEHLNLLNKLATIKGKFMLSGYPSQAYDKWAAHHGFTRDEKSIDNKASSARVKEKKTECVWTNF
jgi:DNA adenine methylase